MARHEQLRCYGFLSDDGRWAHCTREERAGGLRTREGSNTYGHALEGHCPCGETHGQGQARPPRPSGPARPEIPRADADVADRIYARLLAACPPSQEHRAYLTGPACGLPARTLGDYGTLPAGDLQAGPTGALAREFGPALLLGVPGFVPGRGGLRVAGAGLLIAHRDARGLIRGMQVRADGERDGGRYYWLSSAGAGGPGSGSPARVARPPRRRSKQQIWLTEGGKKAHICAVLTQCTAVGIAGHQQVDSAREALEALVPEQALTLVIALDEDLSPGTAAQVDASRLRLAAVAHELGYRTAVARWDPAQAKGIDDLLLGGGRGRISLLETEEED